MRSFLFRLIGILEIAGGFYGASAMLRRLWPPGSTLDNLHALIGLLLFGFVLVAGVLLVEGHERGVRLSSWAQLLQLPLLATPVLSYGLHCGAYLNLYASTARLDHPWLEGGFGSQGFALALAGPAVTRLGINLLALVAWLLLKLR